MSIQVEAFQLSPVQRRIWSLREQTDGGMGKVQTVISMQGPLAMEQLRAAIAQLLTAQDGLTARFHLRAGRQYPLQSFEPARGERFDFLDLTGEAAVRDRLIQEKLAQLWQASGEEAEQTLLIRLDEQQHLLVVQSSAMCLDGRGDLLVTQLASAYAGEALYEEEPISYAAISEFLLEMEGGEESAVLWQYWRSQEELKHLRGALDARLPYEQERGKPAAEPGIPVAAVVPAETTMRLQQLAAKHGLELYDLLLANWLVLLHRLTGESYPITAVGCEMRLDEAISAAVGALTSSVPFGAAVTADRRLVALAQEIHDKRAERAQWNPGFPWDKALDYLGSGLQRQVLAFGFTCSEQAARVENADGLTFAWRQNWAQVEPCKINLACEVLEQGLTLTLTYDRSLYSQADIERLGASFQALLASAADQAEARVSELSVVPDDQRRALLDIESTQSQPPFATLIAWFEAQVQKTPGAPAVVFEGETLSYEALDAQAAGLAARLVQAGIGADAVVGIYLERSASLIVSLLAVLKAGGAYLPIDPKLPAERWQYLLEHSQAALVLTNDAHAGELQTVAARVLNVEAADLESAEVEAVPAAATPSPADLAYILYTSGSTGRPKGVMIEHRQIVNYVHGLTERIAFAPGERFAFLTTFSADIGNTVLFASLVTGGCLHVLSEERASDPDQLAAYLSEHAIDTCKFTPTQLRMLLLTGTAEFLPRKHLLLGGEALPASLLEPLFETAACTFYNHYGPTETTVGVLIQEIRPEQRQAATIPLGTPIANTYVYVLDEHRQLVADGVNGELYIGGANVARGYLHQPELTSERFMANPFIAGERLYRTGDLVKRLPDGSLQFVGRADDQVKIRGFRLELGEIEAVLAEQEGVAQAAAVALAVHNEQQVIGYVVPHADRTIDAEHLRSALEKRLPEYMIPSQLIVTAPLPLLPNGKLDRKALQAKELPKSVARTQWVAPSTETERKLAELWERVLPVDRVSVDDHFFKSGGHSLVATQIIVAIREQFQVNVSLRQIFETPVLGDLARKIEALRGQGTQQADERLSTIAAGRATRDRAVLSFAQQRMWFLDQMMPGTAFYNIPFVVRLHGALHRGLLEQSLRDFLHRHEVLRSNFIFEDGVLAQVVTDGQAFEFAVAEPSDAWELEVEAEVRRPFQLATELPMRGKLFAIGEQDHVLALTMHHIAWDGGSHEILRRELTALYNANLAEGTPVLRELPVQYADYSVWQQDLMRSGERLENLVTYWKEYLREAPALLELPTDRPRPPVQSFRGATQLLEWDAQLLQDLRELSQQQGTTMFMTMLTLFKTLLYRYTGQEDLVVGLPIANRPHRDLEPLVGCFVNTLVMRTQLSGEMSFESLLHQVKERALEAFEHQDLPFERLVDELSPERNLSYNPLFQVAFSYQNRESISLPLTGLVSAPLEIDLQIAKSDLALVIEEGERNLVLAVEYNVDLFDSATIQRFFEHLRTLAKSVLGKPDTALETLEMLAAEERRQLVVDWNETEAEAPSGLWLEFFEKQVQRSPEHTALVFEGESLTYRELNARANRLAHLLQGKGVGPEQIVGICLHRSLEMVIALLGVFKAGAAYLPLDPSYPAERLQWMVEDAGVELLLTQDSLSDLLADFTGEQLLLDAWQAWPDAEDNLPQTAQVDNLAYVIYTSGSTGKPKGVQVEHRGLTNLVLHEMNTYPITPDDRLLHMTSFGFDAALYGILLSLTRGAALYIGSLDSSTTFTSIQQMLTEWKITFANLSPSVLKTLDPESLPDLKWVLSYGEDLSGELTSRWAKQGRRIFNGYGPTEVTIGATSYECTDSLQGGKPPIGRPWPNYQLYVLDRRQQPVPVNVVGELYIAGIGLARGYLNRPEETAKSFLPNPFSSEAGALFYKTGDLVRYRADGNVEFVGRADDQVKFRGYRISLTEIEKRLLQHPEVAEAVVIVRNDSGTRSELVGYVILKPGQSRDAEELRTALKQVLPSFMVPSALIEMEEFPLTVNGKLNTRALPEPSASRLQQQRNYAAPVTELERGIAAIWGEVLGLADVGLHDHFFDIGGHSLIATQILSRMRDRYHVEIPLYAIFESPTVSQLSKWLEPKLAAGLTQPKPTLTPVARTRGRRK